MKVTVENLTISSASEPLSFTGRIEISSPHIQDYTLEIQSRNNGSLNRKSLGKRINSDIEQKVRHLIIDIEEILQSKLNEE